ncbi:MAG: DUF354 domain-containing protein [bacterium]
MRIMVEIQHPAHVHHFKNIIWNLENKGHHVKVATTDKDVTISLLENYGFDYDLLGENAGNISLAYKIKSLLKYELNMIKICRRFKPSVFMARGSPVSAHVSKIFNKPYIISSDSEPAAGFGKLFSFPFADVVCIPSSYNKDLKNSKVIKFDAYKETAYLHPNYFKPDPSILKELRANEGEYIVIRFVNMGAYHDVGKHGIRNKIDFVNELKQHVEKIFISSEKQLPSELMKYKLPTETTEIHNVLYYAKMLISDSQTMTTESALLGTPAIRCNSFVGENDMGNFIELENKYGLIFNYKDPDKALNKAIELLQNPDLNTQWKLKRESMLNDKIDVTAFLTWLVEKYPESFEQIKQNPDIQYQFK